MSRATVATGMELEYDTFGDPTHPALLLVMGLGAQMILWDTRFCQLLADTGRYVIRFDNRDCGLSTKFDGIDVDMNAMIMAMLSGDASALAGKTPYQLSHMAADAVALLDHLNIVRAHIAGASMGGMIVQTMAIEHPDRVASLTSIMSQTGEPAYGHADPAAQAVLMRPPAADRNGHIASSVDAEVIMSKKYRNHDQIRARAAESYDRSFYPQGTARQLAAIVASGSRADGLRQLNVPTVVIHGLDDTLINPTGGRRTAELIPGAVLVELEDMGHDLPEPLWPLIIDAMSKASAGG